MAEPKTRPTKASVADFIAAIDHEQRRKDAKAVVAIYRKVTGEKPTMWGPNIIGFGTYKSMTGGKEVDWPRAGFSPRKTGLVLYLVAQILDSDPLMKKLGKYKTGKVCLYINRLTDVDERVLATLVDKSQAWMLKKHPA